MDIPMRADCWLLAALLVSGTPGRPVALRDLLGSADYLKGAVPTFDELSFGSVRLSAAGWIELDDSAADGFLFTESRKASRLRDLVTGPIRDLPGAVGVALGALPRPEPEAEDRSLGRLPGLRVEDLAVAWSDSRSIARKWLEPRELRKQR